MSVEPWEMGWSAVEALGTALGFLISFVLLLLVLRQLKSDRTTRELDHERRRKEGTFACWQDMQESALGARRLLTRKYGRDEMTEQDARELRSKATTPGEDRDEYAEILYSLREYLNRLERLAVAVEMEVYDIDVVDTVGNTSVRRAWERNRAYVKLVRQDSPGGRQYDALERLHDRLNSRHLERQAAISGGASRPMGRGRKQDGAR